jgi:hypothetical protein
VDSATHFISEELSVRQYQMYVLGNKLFIFPNHVRYETYSNEWYYGIIFIFEGEGNPSFGKDARYDVVHHYHMDWERLIINDKEGWKDIPFHEGTFRFLPDEIKVLKL